MRALVSGGTGFIGSNIALELERKGWQVVIIDRTPSFQPNLVGLKAEIFAQDVSQALTVDGHLDVIFHQAAITDPRVDDEVGIFQTNCRGFERIIELAERKRAKLIYASTAGLYGNGPTPMAEDQPKQCLTAYARSKLWMDELAMKLMGSMHITGLRYFNVFGPGEHYKGRPASMIYHLQKQMKEGKRPRIFQYGEQKRDHIYVKDVVAANFCALETRGIFNVGTGKGTDFNELVSMLNEALGTDYPPEYFPMPYAPETYQHHTCADTTLAKEKLKFEATWKLRDAIRDYMEWIRAN